MKQTLILAALALTAQAVDTTTWGQVSAAPSEHDLYSGNWKAYKVSRPKKNDCDVRESENWLGSGMCKYSWECRGARMCEGNGWCLGMDACDEVSGNMPPRDPQSGAGPA